MSAWLGWDHKHRALLEGAGATEKMGSLVKIFPEAQKGRNTLVLPFSPLESSTSAFHKLDLTRHIWQASLETTVWRTHLPLGQSRGGDVQGKDLKGTWKMTSKDEGITD